MQEGKENNTSTEPNVPPGPLWASQTTSEQAVGFKGTHPEAKTQLENWGGGGPFPGGGSLPSYTKSSQTARTKTVHQHMQT